MLLTLQPGQAVAPTEDATESQLTELEESFLIL